MQYSNPNSNAIEVVIITLTNNTHYVSRVSSSSVNEVLESDWLFSLVVEVLRRLLLMTSVLESDWLFMAEVD